jgi:hypothetical protein
MVCLLLTLIHRDLRTNMAELRLDEVQKALDKMGQGGQSPIKPVSLDQMSMEKLDIYNEEPEIDRASYDHWYEKVIEGMTISENAFLDTVGEPTAQALNFIPDLTNKVVLGATSFMGNFVEAFSSKEKFAQELKELPIISDAIGLGGSLANIHDRMFGPGTKEERKTRTSEYARGELEKIKKGAFKDPTAVDPDKEFMPGANANVAERWGKRLRALSFYGYANTKEFQQRLAQDADHPILSQVGGAFGSITTSALLGSVNPKLAMLAMGGHVGANQYLEQVAKGVDWKPAAGFGAAVGVGVGALENLSLGILFKRYSSRLALAGDSAIVNGIEEFLQSTFESGAEVFVGAEERTLGSILKQAAFEGALGLVGGGVAGATTVQIAYSRMDSSLRKLDIPKKQRHKIIMRAVAEGSDIVGDVLMEGLGVDNADIDIVNSIAEGKTDSKEAILELHRRIRRRQKEKGIDTYLEEDPDVIIAEQQQADALEEAQTRETPMSPEEEVQVEQRKKSKPFGVTEDIKEDVIKGRVHQLDSEVTNIDRELDGLQKELKLREEAGKPVKAVQNKLEKLSKKKDALDEERAGLLTAEEVEVASSEGQTVTERDLEAQAATKKDVKVKGSKLQAIRNRAEAAAAKRTRQELTEKFKQEKADLTEARQSLLEYVRAAFKGQDVPKKFLTRIAKVTPRKLETFLKEVDQARLDIVRPALVNQAQTILDKVAPKVKGGKSVGVLKSAALQDVANELIRVSKLDSQTAQQLIKNKQELLDNYLNEVKAEGGSEQEIDVDRLAFELEVLQNVAGLEAKSEDALMDSIKYIQEKVKLLKEGQKVTYQILQEKREAERAQAIKEMAPRKGFDPAKFFPKWVKNFHGFSVNNLSSMLRALSKVKDIDNSVLGKKIAAVDGAPRRDAAFNFKYMDALDKITKRVFDLKTDAEHHQWKIDHFKEGGGFLSEGEVTLNNGEEGVISLTKADVGYWWLVTHDRDGNILPEVMEVITNENRRNGIFEQAQEEQWSGEKIQAELKKIKGNAIPQRYFDEMMAKFEADPRNIEFVQSQRVLYNTVYSIINPVYRMYNGTDLPRVEDYVPWHRDVGGESEVFSALDDFKEMIQTIPVSAKLRTPGAKAAFKQTGDIEVFQYFIQEMAHFNAYALPMKDVISLLRNKDIRRAINENTDGKELQRGQYRDGDTYKMIRGMADLIMSKGRSNNEMTLSLFNTLRTNLSVAYLGEPSKGVLQTSSMWMALSEPDISWRDWAAGAWEFFNDPKGALEILDKAPMMKFRYKDLMIEMKNVIDSIKTRKKNAFTETRKKAVDAAFYFVRKGNRFGAGLSGYVVMRKVYKETGDINEAYRRFDQHITNTQQSAVNTQLAPFQVGQWTKIVSQFQSAVIQYSRIYVRSYADVAAGRISLQKFADIFLIFHVVMPTMRWLLKGLIRGGDFDEGQLKRDVIMGPLSAGFFITDLLEMGVSMYLGVHSFAAGSPLAGAANKIKNSVARLKKMIEKKVGGRQVDAADLAFAWIEVLEEVSAVTLPVPGVAYDTLQASIKASQGEMSPTEIMSVIMGESVESLEFSKKKGNNKKSRLKRLQGR